MKVTPLLFKQEMIQALIREIEYPGTGKTMTRRTKGLEYINEDPYNAIFEGFSDSLGAIFKFANPIQVHPQTKLTRKFIEYPYGKPGDLIWCRESTYNNVEHQNFYYTADNKGIGNAAYSDFISRGWANKKSVPSIHMPKIANRITLLIEDVRVERLWDIAIEDILREGIFTNMREHDAIVYLQHKWKSLWISINGQESWDRNDWLWVLKFRPILANVDAVLQSPANYGIREAA